MTSIALRDRRATVISSRTLGTYSMLVSPVMFAETARFHFDVARLDRLSGLLEVAYMFGVLATLVGLRRLRATGDGRFATGLFALQCTLASIAAAFSASYVVAPMQPEGSALWTAIDLSWPATHVSMLALGVATLVARRLTGWRRLAPLVAGLALPSFVACMAFGLGRVAGGVAFGALTTLGFGALGWIVRTTNNESHTTEHSSMSRFLSFSILTVGALLAHATPASAQITPFKNVGGLSTTSGTVAGKTTTTTTTTSSGTSTPKTTTTTAALSGNYRVTITGFTVNHETWDNAFELDGKRDEVWIDAEVSLLDRNNNSIAPAQPLRSKTMGDINNQPGRLQAGSASSLGGIRTGDNVPTATPWIASGAGQPDRLPLAVWEGQLVQGQNAVVITPSIWEWDGPQDVVSAYASWWKNTVNSGMKTMQQTAFVQSVFGSPARYWLDLQQTQFNAVTGFAEDIFGKAEDRPIGLDVSGTGPDGRPVYAPKLKMLTLTYESAEALLKQNVNGRGYGVLALSYVDNAKFAGNYTLYVKLEKI